MEASASRFGSLRSGFARSVAHSCSLLDWFPASQLHKEFQILESVDVADQAVVRLEVQAFAEDIGAWHQVVVENVLVSGLQPRGNDDVRV